MNNRKQKNKRGVNPRAKKLQLIPEAKLIDGEPNPKFGLMRKVIHANIKL